MTSNIPLNSHVSRRWLLTGLSAATVTLAGCASTSSSSSKASSSTSTTSTTSVVTGTAAAGSVAALAQAFYKTLDTDQKAAVLLDYSLAYAKRWSNLPQGLLGGSGGSGGSGAPSGAPSGGSGAPNGGSGAPSGSAPSGSSSGSSSGGGSGGNQSRVGVDLGSLDSTQLAAFTKLVKAATGTTTGLGWDEIVQQLNADDYLKAHGGGSTYGRANFYVAILGSPKDSGTWELQFGGHHLAVANTYIDGALAGATPSFRGVEPNAAFRLNGRTNQPLRVKETAFRAMLAGLSADQLATAKLADTYTDLVLGPGNDWSFPTSKAGVRVATLSARQRKLVLAAIATYVGDVADRDARKILATYRRELDKTYVAYSGTTALTEKDDYVRIDGPSVWIEFSMQNGIVLSGNHPHSVWRDRTTDYGGTKS